MQLWWDVPIRDSFDLLRDIYSIDEGRYRHRLDELMTALDLGDIMQSPLRQLSLGLVNAVNVAQEVERIANRHVPPELHPLPEHCAEAAHMRG